MGRHAAAGWALALALSLLAAGAESAPPDREPGPRWGWLGVRIRDLSEQEMNDISKQHGIREGFGALIVEVLKETPAEASGLHAGDIVVGFRAQPVVDTRTLQRYVAGAGVGENVVLTVLQREQGRRQVTVRLGLMPDVMVAERIAAEFGFLVRDPGPQPEPGGARLPASPAVALVVAGSRAAAAGLQAGDVLLEIGGRAVATVGAVHEALLAVRPDGPLELVVGREGHRVPVRIAAPRFPMPARRTPPGPP